MSGLPPHWEWDYDGQRWFYKYKPTGHIQFHFPSEGDEFPDFVQAGEPVPDLAPEERLESQQQVKRLTSTSNHGETTVKRAAEANNLGMSAAAKPVSAVWEGDDDDEEGVFQPENFMFLGPGAYVDVSPLNEEEEEAAKRSVVGGIGERVEGKGLLKAQGVSPLGSGKTTPMMGKSEASATATVENEPSTSPPVEVDLTSSPPEAPSTSAVHILDSREMPAEMPGDTVHRFDPVGFVAEMPTEHTGVAHIELHPDPVEIGDNSVLAPIETATVDQMGLGMSELPEKHSSVEVKPVGVVKTPGERSVNNPEAKAAGTKKENAPEDNPTGKQTIPVGQRPQKQSQGQQSQELLLESFKIARKQPGSTPGTPVPSQPHNQDQSHPIYQSYTPGQISPQLPTSDKRQSISLQREASLMMSAKRESVSVDPSTVPRVLSPPQDPTTTGQSTQSGEIEQNEKGKGKEKDWETGLSHVPSVLKPARNMGGSGQASHQQQQQQNSQTEISARQEQKLEGMSKFPSVLRPARGRSESQPGRGTDASIQPQTAAPGMSTEGGQVTVQPHQTPPSTASVPGQSGQSTSPPASGQAPFIAQRQSGQSAWGGWQAQASPDESAGVIVNAPYGASYANASTSTAASVIAPTLTPASALNQQPQRHSEVAQQQPTSVPHFQTPPAQHIQNAAVGQPMTPQTVLGTVQHAAATVVQPAKQSAATQKQHELSQFQVPTLQNVQNAAAGQSRPQNAAGVAQPVAIMQQQQSHPVSEFQVPQLQNIKNMAAGQPQLRKITGHTHPVTKSGGHDALQNQKQQQQPVTDSQRNIQSTEAGQPLLHDAVQPAQPSPATGTTDAIPLQQHQQPVTASTFSIPPLQNIQNAVAGQPVRPHTTVGVVRHAPPVNPVQPNVGQQQSSPSERTHPGMRRASTFTPGEVSPIRSRVDSQVSSIGETHADPYRRESSSAHVNSSNYTPSPLTDALGPAVQRGQPAATTNSIDTKDQSPPVPAKILEHAVDSFFPVQSTPDRPPSEDKPKSPQQQQPQISSLTQQVAQSQQQQSVPLKESQLQPQTIPPKHDTEHPIGYQVRPSSNQPSPALHMNQHETSAPASGHILGRIQEHDEPERPAVPDQASQVTRPSSVASSLQPSIPDTPSSSQGPLLFQPKPLAPSQIQRLPQQLGQTPMAQPPTGQLPQGYQPHGMIPHSQMQDEITPGPMLQGPQWQWNPAMNPMPPKDGKDKEKKWTKWFKGSSSKSKATHQAQMLPPQPGPIPGPGPQQWTGGPYSPAHIWQSGMAPQGHGQRYSMSDSASISTVGSDRKSQPSQQRPPAQASEPMLPAQGSGHSTEQHPSGQTPQGMIFQGQMPPLSHGQVPHQLRPGNGPPGHLLPAQIPPGQVQPSQMRPSQFLPVQGSGQMLPQATPGQPYFGQTHPLNMPIKPLTQGYGPPQSGFQPQGRIGAVPQGSPNSSQPSISHSKTPSNTSQVSVPPQAMQPQQPPARFTNQQSNNQQNPMPAPLFASSGTGNPVYTQGQAAVNQQPSGSKRWSQRPAVDYSGGDWGDDENWSRR